MASDSEDDQAFDNDNIEDDDAEEGYDDLPTVGREPTEEPEGEEDSEDSEDDDDDEDDEDNESEPAVSQPSMDMDYTPSQTITHLPEPVSTVPPQQQTFTPAQLRRQAWTEARTQSPRAYIVEAICALPHPVPTHALASSHCISHLITGSDDGYIRDYDIFTAVNGKNFLTAPQRQHAGVVEGLMKSGNLRFWWENPGPQARIKQQHGLLEEERALSPVYSLAMQSDALWALAGTDAGHINLFTVRHEPGRLCHSMNAHRGHVSGLALGHDEKSVFSAGWDGDAIQWDLNTGQNVRKFTAHGAQLAAIAVRPESAIYAPIPSPTITRPESGLPLNDSLSNSSQPQTQPSVDNPIPQDSDARSDTSFDPLFDDEPEEAVPAATGTTKPLNRPSAVSIAPPKNAPPLFDTASYSALSPDMLMTASIDGQVILWDKRMNSPGKGVGRLWMSEKTPPWCLSACWSADGAQIYAGRRNGSVDAWDVRQLGISGPGSTPRLLKTLRNPLSSGVVSCVVAFPDSKHIACASVDNLRLWNVAEAGEPDSSGRTRSGVQFKIIPGHHGGYVSQMLVDPGARFLVSASSNRGWYGDSTRTVFVHDIKHVE